MMNSDMNDNHLRATLLQLQQRGLVAIDAIDKSGQTTLVDNNFQEHTPWFIQVLFGLSGVVASLFFIGFLTLLLEGTGVLDSAIMMGIIGLLLNASGFCLFKYERRRDNVFLNSLALMTSVAGQSYVIYALSESGIATPFSVWIFLLLQSALTLIVPSFMYRLLNSVVAFGCVVYLLNYYYLPEISLGLLALVAVVSHLQRYKLLQRVPTKWRAGSLEIIKAVGYASALMLICVSVYFIAAEYGHGFESDGDAVYHYYVAQVLLTLASLYAAYLILKRYQIKLLSATGFILSCMVAVLGIVSIYVSGLLATCLIIVIAMANSQRTLLAIGIFALVCYVFWYYYQLDTSLLVKSISMLVVGIALLLMRWLLIKRYFVENLAHPATDSQERLS